MTRLRAAGLVCAGLFAASSSMAASEASATITGLTFTLIDLNPFDGVDPTVSFTSTLGTTSLSVSASDSNVGESESASRSRAGTFSFSKEYLAQLTNSGAWASVGDKALSAVGYANGPGTSFNASASTGAASSYYYPGVLNVSLSANSALLISANLSLSAAATNGTCTDYWSCNSSYYPSDTATATGSLSLSYSYYGNGVSVNYTGGESRSVTATSTAAWYDYTSVYNPNTGWYDYVSVFHPASDQSSSLDQVLSATFTNMSLTTQSASLGLAVSAIGKATSAAVIPAVPEASSLLMSLAGLGMIGAHLSRRRNS